jgi:hypothetical protein
MKISVGSETYLARTNRKVYAIAALFYLFARVLAATVLLSSKFVEARAESPLLRRAGLQSPCGNARKFVGRGFSHDINATE